MKQSDENIIKGFQTFDPKITKEYFYGYCRRAYLVLDNKYQLKNKVGLDFYSLAHEYYLQLLNRNFEQLHVRPENMKLSAFMFKGFWFVTMDALKAHKKEIGNTSDADVMLQYVRSSDREEGMMEQIATAVSNHYYKDSKMGHLAWEIFVHGFRQNEVGAELGLTPSAVNQRYKKMMQEVVTPFVIENYGKGIYLGGKSLASPSSVIVNGFTQSDDIREMYNRPYEDECCRNIVETEDMFMEDLRITPEIVTSLKENEIFVFGSNLSGIHAGGAAHMARVRFGAEMGNGVGRQGQSYAIPTMQGGVETIKPYVDQFLAYASQHPELHFLVTAIGCGIAGFEPKDIAPMFEAAMDMENISLPESFRNIL